MWNKTMKSKSRKRKATKRKSKATKRKSKASFGMLSRLRREIQKSRKPRGIHPRSLTTKKGSVKVFMSKPPGIELLIPKRALSELIRKSTKRNSRRRRYSAY